MLEWKKLGDVCEIKGRIGFRGYTRDDQVDKGEGAISLSPGNIDNGSLNYDSCTYITWEKYEESPEIMVNVGDIILCKTASVGKVARIHYLPQKATINPQLVLIKNIKTNPQYLFYVLGDNLFQAKIKGLAGVGSVPNVSQAKLASIPIPIPSSVEQTRIVGILDTFTASIENLKQQIAERRKQYEYYRDQLLDLEGQEGMEMKTLGSIMHIVRGASPRPIKKFITTKEEGVNWIKIGDVAPNAKYITSTNERITKEGAEKSRCLKAGDFILSNSMSFGRPYILKIDGCIHDGWIAMSGFDSFVIPDYLYEYLNTEIVQKYWKMKANNGGAMTNLNTDIVKDTPILIPSKKEQSHIVSILDTFEASIANLEAQLKEREKQYEYYRNKLLTFE